MIRRLKLLFATVLVLLAPAIFALGLGELDLQSALNQQFKAEVKLTNLRGLQIDEVIPNLASQADFDRVGVERNYILTNLRFKVVESNGRDLIIQISSNKPVVEPFLNFIVEVLWPNGRILREYTVLLDPPVFGDEGVEAIVSTETESRSAPRPQEAKKPSNNSSSRTSTGNTSVSQSQASPQIVEASPQQGSSTPASQEGMVDDEEYGVTGAGDTLWTIALKVRPNSSVSVQQTMLALQRANPEAFINNNINLLKAGHVLRIPDAREIREGSIASAVREVRIQNAEFDAYKTGSLAQLDATRRQTNAQSATSGGDGGELKLLASNQSSGNRAGEGNNARTQALEDNLAVAEEDLDRTRRANTEMNVRLDDLQSQLETLNEILTLKDDQLAALRAEIQKMQATTPSSTPVAATASTGDESGLMTTIAAVLGAIVAFLIAVAGLIFMRRRQQAKALDDEFEEDLLEENIDSEEDDVESESEEDLVEEEEEEVTQETNDVISEVEIYIAYGRFPQAITFLQNAIEAEPRRSDIQLKLLEVYVQTEDSTAFNLQFEQLRMLGDEDANKAAQALQVKIPGAAEDAAASMDATIISSEPIVAIEQVEDDDDDFSFDLDDLGSETEDDDLNLTDELNIDDVELDLDLDLDGDDEISLDLNDDDEISLDLDIDDEITLDLEGEDEISLDLDDDDEISLDLDDDEITLDLEGEDEISLDLDDDDEISLDLDDDDEITLDLEGEDEISLDLDDEDEISLDLDSDDEITLDLEGEDEISLDLDDEDEDEISLDLDSDDEITFDLEGEDEISLDLDDEDEISLDLDDDELSLDLEGEDEISLDLDDDALSLDLDEDEGNKLDLARAYIDMGDSDGAKSVLKDVLSDGSAAEVLEANELLEKID